MDLDENETWYLLAVLSLLKQMKEKKISISKMIKKIEEKLKEKIK